MQEVFETFEAAEAAIVAAGRTPFRVEFETDHPKHGKTVGQVQSVETGGPATYGHPDFCVWIAAPKPTGVELLDTGGCPSIQHEPSRGGFNGAPGRTIVRSCYFERGHAGNHRDALGFEWTDAQAVS